MGLPHLLAASGSGAGSSARAPPARLTGAARSPPGGARGAGPARSEPLPLPPGPRPPAAAANAAPPSCHAHEARQSPSWGGAQHLNPFVAASRTRAGLTHLTHTREGRVCPNTLSSSCYPKTLGLSPQSLLSSKFIGTAPSATSLAIGKSPSDLGKGSRRLAPALSRSSSFRTQPPNAGSETQQVCTVRWGRVGAGGSDTSKGRRSRTRGLQATVWDASLGCDCLSANRAGLKLAARQCSLSGGEKAGNEENDINNSLAGF